jgi:hypothetical protein
MNQSRLECRRVECNIPVIQVRKENKDRAGAPLVPREYCPVPGRPAEVRRLVQGRHMLVGTSGL